MTSTAKNESMSVVASPEELDSLDHSDKREHDKTENIQFIEEMLEKKTEDNDSKINDSKNEGVPAYVKFGIPLFALALIFGFFSLYWTFFINEEESSEVINVKPEVNTYLSEPQIIEQDSDFIPASANEPSDNIVLASLSDIDGNKANDPILPIENKIEVIEKKVESLIRDANLSDREIKRLKKSITENEDVEDLTFQITTISDQLANLEGRFVSEIRGVTKYRQHKREVPPFSLIAIDQWGGSYSARVLHNGREFVLEQGEVLHGWIINGFVGYKELNVCNTKIDKCLEMRVH